jgi:hypothetical protein
VNEAPEVQLLAVAKQISSQVRPLFRTPSTISLTNRLSDVAALMELRRATARFMMTLLGWYEFGRSLAMPGLSKVL